MQSQLGMNYRTTWPLEHRIREPMQSEEGLFGFRRSPKYISSFPEPTLEDQKLIGQASAVAQALKDKRFDRANDGRKLIVQLAVCGKAPRKEDIRKKACKSVDPSSRRITIW